MYIGKPHLYIHITWKVGKVQLGFWRDIKLVPRRTVRGRCEFKFSLLLHSLSLLFGVLLWAFAHQWKGSGGYQCLLVGH